MELKRVVVTGLGAITPLGNNVEESWENLKQGKSGAAPITHFDASQFKTQFACEVKNFNALDYIDRKEVRKMDIYTQYALVAAKMAIADSGMDLETIDKNETVSGTLSFTVDHPKRNHWLVFYDKYKRVPVARYSLSNVTPIVETKKEKRKRERKDRRSDEPVFTL